MNMNLLFGIFAGYYFGNEKFRHTTDGHIKNLMSKGIDTLNKTNGGNNNDTSTAVDSTSAQPGGQPLNPTQG
jgi:hypothetical protein